MRKLKLKFIYFQWYIQVKQLRLLGALSTQTKIPEISVGTSNWTDHMHFGLVRPEYSGPALKVVHFDRSGRFGRSDRNVPFHLTKLLSPVRLLWYPDYKNNNQTSDGLGLVCATGSTVPLGTRNFRNFKPEFLLNGKRLVVLGLPHILTLIVFLTKVFTNIADFVVISRHVLAANFSILERFEIKRPPRWWLSQYIYNKHNTTWKVPRCLCNRNLTRSLRSLVRFLIRQQLVRK